MSFGDDLQKFADKTGLSLETVVKKTAMDLFKDVIMDTPVLTGRARGNWQLTYGSPATGIVDVDDKNGSATTTKVAQELEGFSIGLVIWLTNNLPYILKLENGWSGQAPSGMVERNVQRWQEYFRNQVGSL